MYKKTDALGVFDSGVGGLTVVKALMERLPKETLYYLADTHNLPYGNKDKDQIEKCSLENIHFLLGFPIKALVIACNTASALAYESMKRRFNIPIFDVISPAVAEASRLTKNQKIAVLATESTIHSNVYETLLKARMPKASVISIACPLLVPVVEESLLKHRLATKLIQQYLAPLQDSEVDTLILGCTHYPLLKELIKNELDPSVEVIDSAGCTAEQIKLYLEESKLESSSKKGGMRHYFVSSNPESFEKKGSLFLGQKISSVKKVEPSRGDTP